MTPIFKPPPGTRFPRESDREQTFEASGPLKGRLTLEQILALHAPQKNEFSLFRVYKGRVAGAACFALNEQDVQLDFLTRNDLFTAEGVSVGGVLVAAVESFAAFHGRDAVTLEAMDGAGLIAWYSSRGFEREVASYRDPEWGDLFPMVKRVAPMRLGGP